MQRPNETVLPIQPIEFKIKIQICKESNKKDDSVHISEHIDRQYKECKIREDGQKVNNKMILCGI